MPAHLPYDIAAGNALSFGVTQAMLPQWVLQQPSLATVLSGTFEFSLSRNGAPLFTLPASVGNLPTYQAPSAGFVAMFYTFVGGEFGATTGFYWVTLRLLLSSGNTIPVDADTLTVTTPWGQV